MSEILSKVSLHDEWRLQKCLNLQCSENVTSEAVRRILSSDMGHRYTLPINQEVHGSYVGNAYRGTRYMDAVETRGEEIAKGLFDGGYATLKPLSGHIAGMIMLLATCRKGDRILVIDTKHGGYDGYLSTGMAGMLGFRVALLPFDSKRWNVDADTAATKIRSYKPKLVVLGASFILFPYNLKPMRQAADDIGALIGYDGSHVLGLIAGAQFQKPLVEGADILTGSTHKSMFGPQGGIVVCKDGDVYRRILETFCWKVMDNAHWNRIAALTQALLEAKKFGKGYARQVVRNSKALAKELDSRGLPIKFPDLGYTECHQIHIDEGILKRDLGLTLNGFADRLERCNVIADAVGRIGTNEVTRMGLEEDDMAAVADIVMGCAKGMDVRKNVASLRSEMKMKFYS